MLGFLMCAVFGGVLLVALLVTGAAGGAETHDVAPGHEHAGGGGHDGLTWHALVGLRPLAAAATFFGLVGAGLRAAGAAGVTAGAGAVAAGLLAAGATALLLRSLLRFESDGTVQLDRALGAEATVYLAIPPGGAGKVHVSVQGRLVESLATAADGAAYPTGARVLVVDRAPDGGLLVAADPTAPAERASALPLSRSAPL